MELLTWFIQWQRGLNQPNRRAAVSSSRFVFKTLISMSVYAEPLVKVEMLSLGKYWPHGLKTARKTHALIDVIDVDVHLSEIFKQCICLVAGCCSC